MTPKHNHGFFARALALLLSGAMAMGPVASAQQQPNPRDAGYKISVTTEIVLVNVVVRDKQGNFVKGLSRDDFTVQEDGKAQRIESFDSENIDALPLTSASAASTGPAQVVTQGAPEAASTPAKTTVQNDTRNKRLIVMFFDLSGMQEDEVERSLATAQKYVDKQMSPADLVSVVVLSTSFSVLQDFTGDKALVTKALKKLNPAAGQGMGEGANGDTESTPDTGQSFTADESEFNIFNTDRKFQALQSLAMALAKIEQKKSIIYFGSGISRNGVDNQIELRAAINAAVKANCAIYTVDIRGLEAMPPGGAASQASLRGVGIYSGQAVRNQYDSNFATQETLYTVAHDTGGQAFLDTNDFGKVFDKVQQDSASYYVIGYRSNNPLRDGRYRKITVKTKRGEVKLDYRAGYYAPRDFQHSTKDDREEQLQAELGSDLPSTDLPVYLSTAFFRLSEGHFFVPVSIVVPGSEIPFTKSADKDKATIDIIGVVREATTKIPLANARETVKLTLDESQQVRRKNVQYNTGFTLPPGNYHLKFVVRENQSGRIGSFETDLSIPGFKKTPLKMSSIVIGSQMLASKRKSENPLVRDGAELLPNVAHVFAPNQTLYFYYEVYDPAKQPKDGAQTGAKSVHVLTSIAFFNGKVKAYETPLVEANDLNAPERKAAAFQLQVPLAKLRPGVYTCQVNVIDDTGGSFAFPRVSLLVRETKAGSDAAAGAGTGN
jgi:VWFA-related protein